MRILHLSDRLTDRGGAYWHLLGVIAHQVGEHDVRLAVGLDDGRVATPCETLQVEGLDRRDRAPVALSAVVRSFAPDVIHVHTVMNPEVLEQVGALGSVRKVLTVQDHRYFCPGKGKWTDGGEVCREPMTETLCQKCFHDDRYFHEILALTRVRLEALGAFELVVLSRYMKRELEAVGLSSMTAIHLIPPFVHRLDRLDNDTLSHDGPPCILFVGRLVEAKGALEAVEVWKRARPDLPLVMAGAGSLRGAIDGCELLGWVPHDRLGALYRRAAAVVMPSRWQEPFGIVGLEAMTMGTPVAAWDSGGVRDWHPDPVAWGDLDALADRLREIAGRNTSAPAGFTPERLMSRLLDVYQGAGIQQGAGP